MELPPFASLYPYTSEQMDYTIMGQPQTNHTPHVTYDPSTETTYEVLASGGPSQYHNQQDCEVSSTTKSATPTDSADDMYFTGPKTSQNTLENAMERSQVLWNGRGRRTADGHKTRRRVPNASQRKAANVRERKRMLNLNSAFDNLRECIPTFAYEKHLSRIDTLRLAMGYIRFMCDIIECPAPDTYAKYANAAEEMKAKWSADV